MPGADTAQRGRRLLESRIAEAPDRVERVPPLLSELRERPSRLPRTLVTTGIGTSAGHARHLAEVASRWAGQPARFVSTGALAGGAPPDASEDWLVVFSQGLSPNARFALRHAHAWGGVLLVTGLSTRPEPGAEDGGPERREWLEALAEAGVVRLELGCGPESGALVRVIGARVGYALGWSVLRSLCARRLESLSELDFDPSALREAQLDAAAEAARVFAADSAVRDFFDASRTLVLVGEGGLLSLASQLSLKLSEGMLRPEPLAVDVLEFAHGPLQSLVGRPASILYLESAGETRGGLDGVARLESTLDPDLHELRVLRARLPAPLCVLELEAMLDALVLRRLEDGDVDLVDWPGRDRDEPLYGLGPEHPPGPRARDERVRPVSLDTAVWPEVEEALAAGRRTALVGLGSVEQHGPHLPLGTDAWIADALARGLAARIQESVALPAIPFGCAPEHLAFPGTLSLEPETLERILVDLLGSLSRHGFERAFVFSAHGGNVEALDAMRARLVRAGAPMRIAIETDLARVARMQAQRARDHGLEPESAGPHAGEYETSVVAALRPGAVRIEALERGRVLSAEAAQALFLPSLREQAPTGVVGDPRGARAERGGPHLDAWIDLLEQAYRAAFGADGAGPEKKLT